jgi:DNA-binding response OmpR family regulator
LLRRRDESVANSVIEAGAYRLAATQVWMNGDRVALSAADLQLARLLFGRLGQLLSKDVMARATGFASHREVDEAMSRLRKTLAIEPAKGYRIVTLSGYGYRLERL